MSKRNPDELKPADEKFAAGIARGLEQADAYRKSRDCKAISPQRIAERASRLASKPQVRAIVSEVLHEGRVQHIDLVGQACRQLLEDMDSARQDRNHAALARYGRILCMVRDNLHLTLEGIATVGLYGSLAAQ